MAERCKVEYQIALGKNGELGRETRQCPRDAVQDGCCHFHLDDPDKSLEPFVEEIKRLSASSNCKDIDLSHFIFPRVSFQCPVVAGKPLYIEHCTFHGDASFRGLHFHDYTSFHSTDFMGDANFGDDSDPPKRGVSLEAKATFESVTFRKKANFRACRFKELPVFKDTVFNDAASFVGAELAKHPKSQWLEFRNCEFRGEADLHFRATGNIAGIRFAYCNLAGLKIATLPRENLRIEFENTKAWDEKKKWYQWGRKKIRDEHFYRDDPVKVVDSYRYLEEYFFEHSDFHLARHFYLGQMVVTRRDKNYDKPSRLLNWFYQLASNYGESILRPAACLTLSLALFPLILLVVGMNVTRPDPTEPTKEHIVWVNYDVADLWENGTDSPGPYQGGSDPSHIWEDYKSTFGANLSLSTFDRKHELSPPSDSLQKGILVFETILNLILGSLIVVACRRKFTPKKPQGK